VFIKIFHQSSTELILSVFRVLHVAYLATNFLLIKLLPLGSLRDDYNSRAVLLVTSQVYSFVRTYRTQLVIIILAT
jgi:hypothetical protein